MLCWQFKLKIRFSCQVARKSFCQVFRKIQLRSDVKVRVDDPGCAVRLTFRKRQFCHRVGLPAYHFLSRRASYLPGTCSSWNNRHGRFLCWVYEVQELFSNGGDGKTSWTCERIYGRDARKPCSHGGYGTRQGRYAACSRATTWPPMNLKPPTVRSKIVVIGNGQSERKIGGESMLGLLALVI